MRPAPPPSPLFPYTTLFRSWVAEKNGYTPATVTQPMYNLLARGIEQEYLPMCREFGIANVIYNPLAGGLLTGKQRKDAPIAGDRKSTRLNSSHMSISYAVFC